MPTLTDQSLIMTNSFLQQQKKHIAAIYSLIRETSAEEKEMIERVQKNTAAASIKKKEESAECKQSFSQRRDETTAKKEHDLKKIEERRVLEPHLLKEKHEKRINEINSSAKEIIEQTETKLLDSTWLAESVYEGAMRGPRQQAQDATNNLEDTREQLDALCEESPRVLSKLRQTHAHHGTNDALVIEKSMSAYTDIATKTLRAIKTDAKAKWFSGHRPHLIILLCTGAAVATAGAYTQWELNTTFYSIPILTAAISAIILAITYVSGKNSVRKKQILFR